MSDDDANRLKGLAGRLVRRAGRSITSRLRRTDAPIRESAHVEFRDPEGNVLAEGTVSTGVSLLAIADLLGLELDHFCGGQCSCGTCRVKVLNGADHLTKMAGTEEMVLGTAHRGKSGRLACQARLIGDVVIEVPVWF